MRLICRVGVYLVFIDVKIYADLWKVIALYSWIISEYGTRVEHLDRFKLNTPVVNGWTEPSL